MSESIIVAVLALIGTLGGSWMGVRQANKLTNYRLDELTEKVDKHNHLVERMAVVEGEIKAIQNEIKFYHQN